MPDVPHRRPIRRAALVVALVAVQLIASAAAAPVAFRRTPDAERLEGLAAADAAAAWARLQPLRADFEGDPAFDMLLARVALAEGHPQVARLALERVEFFAPETPGVRALLVSTQLATRTGAEDFAPAPPPVDRAALEPLDLALREGQWERGYERATELRAEWEGDAAYDYLLGLAALETGRAEEAVFALQRVLFLAPDQVRVRAHLARAHFVGGNLDQAEAEFRRVLDEGPPPAIRQSIQGYLGEIEAQRNALRPRLIASVGAGAGYDTNVNSATADDVVDTPLGTFALGEGGRELDSGFNETRVNLVYEHPLSRRRKIDVVLAGSMRHNFEAHDFDLDVYRLEAGYSLAAGAGELRGAVLGSWAVLGGETFQRTAGLGLGFDASFGALRVGAGVDLTAVRFPDAPLRDVDRLGAELTARWIAGRDLVALGLTGATERARESDGDHFARDLAAVSASWTRLVAAGHLPFLRVQAQESRHRADHPVFAERREDSRRSAAVGWNWLVNDELSAQAELNYTEADSTLALFDFERVLVQTGLNYRF